MNPKGIFIFFIGNLLILFSACKPNEVGTPIPSIAFKSLALGTDSASLLISFIDGDGDIGLSQSDTTADYKFNCFVDVYLKRAGQWEMQVFPLPYYYRLPILNKGDKKILDGEIRLTLFDFPPDLGTPGIDTMKVSIYIKDRALHSSNTVFSQEFLSKN